MKVLFAGCGDIAVRTITKLQDLNSRYQLDHQFNGVWQTLGMRRHIEKLPAGITAISGDVRDSEALAHLLAEEQIDILVVTLTPSEMSDEGYRQSYVLAAESIASAIGSLAEAQKHSPSLVIWVSSTGVYGQHQGEWVDESAETAPTSYRGKRLLEAEKVIDALPITSVIVRFSGIYGPGRSRLIQQVRAGKSVPKHPIAWTNRIHAEDCAGVIIHLMKRFVESEHLHTCYIGTDSQPVPSHEVRKWIAAELGVPFHDVTDDEGSTQPSPSEQKLSQGRRCSNQRLHDSGYEFQYPSYREGYIKANIERENKG